MAVVTDEPPSGPVGFRQRSEVAYEVVVTSIVRGGHGIELMGHPLHSPTQEAGGALGLAIQEEHGDLCVETMTKRGCCSVIFSFLKQVNAATAGG